MTEGVVVTKKVIQLEETVATRSYPYSQKMLDQQHELRDAMEKDYWEETGESVIVPAPVVIAEALDRLHQDYFPNKH